MVTSDPQHTNLSEERWGQQICNCENNVSSWSSPQQELCAISCTWVPDVGNVVQHWPSSMHIWTCSQSCIGKVNYPKFIISIRSFTPYVYMEKNTHIIYLKSKIFLFFSGALSMWNQIANKNTDNSGTWWI